MKRFCLALLASLVLFVTPLPYWVSSTPSVAAAQKTTHVKGYTTKSGKTVKAYDRKPPKAKATTAKPKASTACATCARDSKGKIARSETSKERFMRQTVFPKGRPGFVVDHIVPLACGGADLPSNMQWQMSSDAKAKDKVERMGCREA